MMQKSDLEGKRIRLVDFPGQVFYLTYAGWDDQWIVRDKNGVDMLRCSGAEARPYLLDRGNDEGARSHGPLLI